MKEELFVKTINPFDEEVILTKATWENIIIKHPEVIKYLHKIERTINLPDFIKTSVYDIRTKLYYRYQPEILNGKYFVVVVKSADKNFISTTYITNEIIKGGKIIWKKQ
ncbi:MAG: hypothetical protein HY738_10150 [Bacteroidia bacterium]|nr:hypothetical protein [Bacteroidia bacterium]